MEININHQTRRSHFIPENGHFVDIFDLREECTQYGMWAIVSLNWTKELADWLGCSRRVLEIMAGNGWMIQYERCFTASNGLYSVVGDRISLTKQ